MKTRIHRLGVNRKNIAFSLVLGMAIAFSSALAIPLFKLAYEQNALSQEFYLICDRLQLFLEWPALLLYAVFGYTGYIFFHPHAAGTAFWHSFVGYIMINGIGWSLAMFLALSVAAKIGAWTETLRRQR